MKKEITIRIIVDTKHEWVDPKHFISNEIDEAIDDIRSSGGRKYRNCSGKTDSKATVYTVSVKHNK